MVAEHRHRRICGSDCGEPADLLDVDSSVDIEPPTPAPPPPRPVQWAKPAAHGEHKPRARHARARSVMSPDLAASATGDADLRFVSYGETHRRSRNQACRERANPPFNDRNIQALAIGYHLSLASLRNSFSAVAPKTSCRHARIPSAQPATTSDVLAQSPLVGAQLNLRTLTVAQRMANPPSQEGIFYAVGNRLALLQLLADLEITIDDITILVDTAPMVTPPAFRFRLLPRRRLRRRLFRRRLSGANHGGLPRDCQ